MTAFSLGSCSVPHFRLHFLPWPCHFCIASWTFSSEMILFLLHNFKTFCCSINEWNNKSWHLSVIFRVLDLTVLWDYKETGFIILSHRFGKTPQMQVDILESCLQQQHETPESQDPQTTQTVFLSAHVCSVCGCLPESNRDRHWFCFYYHGLLDSDNALSSLLTSFLEGKLPPGSSTLFVLEIHTVLGGHRC